MPQKQQSDIQTEVIKTYRRAPDGENGTEILVIRYIKDGKAFAPQLINREVYTDRISKQRKHGKTKGWKWGDIKFLMEDPKRLPEILELLQDIPTRKQYQAAEERLPYSDGPKTEEKDPFQD